MAARLRLLSAGVALLLGTGACIQDDGSRFNPIPGQKRVSADSERELGYQFDREAQAVLPLIDDLAVLEFLNDLGQMLVDRLGEQPFDYRFRVVVNPELNAFAIPGGYVYFHTGTLLAMGDVEELVGVLSHELAHVKGRHYARLVEQAALPNLLTNLAAIAATAATGEAAPLLAAQGLNVALQLSYTRQFEDEADRVGAIFMTRAGFRPEGMVRFFERIQLQKQSLPPGVIPPYLYSHPDVEDRIQVVRRLGEQLRPVREPPPLGERFREMQARLAFLLARNRTSWNVVAPFDRERTDPLLDRAAKLAAAGERDAALALLDEAERAEPNDPRVPYRRGELLDAAGRTEDAVAAYRRAVFLDPSRAAVLLALARAHRAAGNRRQELFFLEQAVWQASPRGSLRVRAERELERMIFPVVAESGFADPGARQADTVAGLSLEALRPDAERLAWWARIAPHHLPYAPYLRVQWIAPSGELAEEVRPVRDRRVFVIARHRFAGGRPTPGRWQVRLLLGEDVVHEEAIETR